MPVSPDGKSIPVGRNRHYCFPSQTLRSAVLRRAESVCVLCGKYSSTLRRVRFGTPQGILLFYAGGEREMSVAFHCVVGDGATARAEWRTDDSRFRPYIPIPCCGPANGRMGWSWWKNCYCRRKAIRKAPSFGGAFLMASCVWRPFIRLCLRGWLSPRGFACSVCSVRSPRPW